jgi:hypothetical protein
MEAMPPGSQPVLKSGERKPGVPTSVMSGVLNACDLLLRFDISSQLTASDSLESDILNST